MRLSRTNVAVGGLGLWNLVVNRFLPEDKYVPANLAIAALAYVAGRAGGASNSQLGTAAADARSGTRWGLAGGVVVGAASLAASRLTATRHLFDDQRAADADTAYETLVRIPLGTVVLEEVAFRSVLPAILDGPERNVVSLRSGVWFGLWHILPTLNTLDINGIEERSTRVKAVAGGVAVTAAAGLIFDKVRLRSGSVLAPMLIHWSANAVSYAVAARRFPRVASV